MSDFAMTPIGVIESCFKEKCGTPRQSGLVPSSHAIIRLQKEWNGIVLTESLRGLETFSHLWVVFWFHDLDHDLKKPLVRPPRLGGSGKTGIFASRAPHRPNP